MKMQTIYSTILSLFHLPPLGLAAPPADGRPLLSRFPTCFAWCSYSCGSTTFPNALATETETPLIDRPEQYTLLEDKDAQKKMGVGGFSECRVYRKEKDGKKFVIKAIRDSLANARNEVACLASVSAAASAQGKENYIARLEGLLNDQKPPVRMLLEYSGGGDLSDYLKNNLTPLSELEAFFYFKQILDVLEFVHSLGIVHRDVKLENFVLDESKQHLKLIDFGFAWGSTSKRAKSVKVRTPDHLVMAPEHLLDPDYLRRWDFSTEVKADIWGAGVILFMLVTRYIGVVDISNVKRTIQDRLESEDLRDLLLDKLLVDKEKRASIEEIRKSRWFVRMEEELEGSGKSLGTRVVSKN